MTESNQTDEELISLVLSGDSGAFEPLMRRYEKMVFSLAMSKLRHRENAEDISQEVFLRAYRMLASFHRESSFSTWLYRITDNIIIDHYRKYKNSEKKTASLSYSAGEDAKAALDIPDGADGPEETAVRKERIEAVRAAIQNLPDEYREVIVLREMQDYSYDDIAATLGLEIGTVKSRISRAKEKIKKMLSDFGKLI
ncbi:RNA polymerase sigma factor [Clostridia bacterium]|nr:RNA polymerase sigma factor [Clostridia bacterium]